VRVFTACGSVCKGALLQVRGVMLAAKNFV